MNEERLLNKIKKIARQCEKLRKEMDNFKPEHKHLKAEWSYIKTNLSSLINFLEKTCIGLQYRYLKPEKINEKEVLNITKRLFKILSGEIQKLKSKNGIFYASQLRHIKFIKKLKGGR